MEWVLSGDGRFLIFNLDREISLICHVVVVMSMVLGCCFIAFLGGSFVFFGSKWQQKLVAFNCLVEMWELSLNYSKNKKKKKIL